MRLALNGINGDAVRLVDCHQPAGQPFKQALADGNLSFKLKNGIATLDDSPLQLNTPLTIIDQGGQYNHLNTPAISMFNTY